MYLVQTRNLHSTIFILIPNPSCQYPPKQTFTFYYIYINTKQMSRLIDGVIHLHSTIFILIPNAIKGVVSPTVIYILLYLY